MYSMHTPLVCTVLRVLLIKIRARTVIRGAGIILASIIYIYIYSYISYERMHTPNRVVLPTCVLCYQGETAGSHEAIRTGLIAIFKFCIELKNPGKDGSLRRHCPPGRDSPLIVAADPDIRLGGGSCTGKRRMARQPHWREY